MDFLTLYGTYGEQKALEVYGKEQEQHCEWSITKNQTFRFLSLSFLELLAFLPKRVTCSLTTIY